MRTFERGDIVITSLNPTSGKELQGERRPCLVISPRIFNQVGLTYVAPITQGGNIARLKGFAVSLMGTGTRTQGVVLVSNVRSLDLNARSANKVEVAPKELVDEVLSIFNTIFE